MTRTLWKTSCANGARLLRTDDNECVRDESTVTGDFHQHSAPNDHRVRNGLSTANDAMQPDVQTQVTSPTVVCAPEKRGILLRLRDLSN